MLGVLSEFPVVFPIFLAVVRPVIAHVVRPVADADGTQNSEFVTYKYGICSLR
jgi:hypothetical protein